MSLLASLQKKRQELAAKGGREKTGKLPPGNSRWRILPHWAGKDEMPSQDYGAHFVKNKAGEVIAVYICTLRTFGKPCEICDELNTAIASASDPELKKQLEEAKSAQRYLLNAVRLNPTTRKYDDAVTLLEVSSPVVTGILSVAMNYAESDGVNIFDLKEGFDVMIDRQGTGLNTKYNVMPAPKSSSIDPSYMEKITNLDTYVAQEHEEGRVKTLSAIRSQNANTPMLAAPRNVTPGALPAAVSGRKAPIEGTATTVKTAAPADDDVEDALSDLDLSDVDLAGLEDVGS
jgi:hypothetical protein